MDSRTIATVSRLLTIVKDKIPADDKAKLEAAIDDAIKFLDSHPAAEKEEYEEKQKALEAIALPILQNLGGAAGGMPNMGDVPGGAGGTAPAADPAGGPTIEEID
jgi:heat shock 70kDa protein 1/2/6/8